MNLNEYQERAMTTCMKNSRNPLYMLFMLAEEIGELHGKFSKAIRKGQIEFNQHELVLTPEIDDPYKWRELVAKEIGDCLWGIAGISHVMGWSLEEIAKMNLDKLQSRQQRNVIDGNGDNR